MHEISKNKHRRGDKGETMEIQEDRKGGTVMTFTHVAEGLPQDEAERIAEQLRAPENLRSLTKSREIAFNTYFLQGFGGYPSRKMVQFLIDATDYCEEHGLTITAEQAREVTDWQIAEGV